MTRCNRETRSNSYAGEIRQVRLASWSGTVRLACRVLGQHRSTQRKVWQGRANDDALTADIIALASEYRRYGYPH